MLPGGDEIELYCGVTNIIEVFQVIGVKKGIVLLALTAGRVAFEYQCMSYLQSRVVSRESKGLAIQKWSSLRLVVDPDGGTAVLRALDLQTAGEVPLLDFVCGSSVASREKN